MYVIHEVPFQEWTIIDLNTQVLNITLQFNGYCLLELQNEILVMHLCFVGYNKDHL